MNEIELLFREFRREKPIQYEEFIAAGWTKEKYLEYVRKCELIRSGIVFERGFYSELSTEQRKQCEPYHKSRNQTLQMVLDSFLDWIGNEMDCPIGSFHVETTVLPSAYLISFFDPTPEIYLSADDFRFEIERFINIIINKDFGQIEGDDLEKLKTEYIEHAIEKIEDVMIDAEPPEEPDLNSYYSLQCWARDMEEYRRIQDESYTIEALEEELEKRKRKFKPESDILYIYSGSRICRMEHTSMIESVTAEIQGIEDDLIQMNVNYCPYCKIFFLKHSEYERYRAKYKMLPIRMRYISSSDGYDFSERDDYSILSLAGYSVSKSAGLSEQQRQLILIKLMENGCSKYEIMNLLDLLINTNGLKKNMAMAREKWRNDLSFVRNYNLDGQRHVRIDRIE